MFKAGDAFAAFLFNLGRRVTGGKPTVTGEDMKGMTRNLVLTIIGMVAVIAYLSFRH